MGYFMLDIFTLQEASQRFTRNSYLGYMVIVLEHSVIKKVLPVGLSDALKTSRFKVFCPRCEEVYLPKFRSINIDGAYYGTSFPHVFLKHYPEAVILPPKIYYYEPKIYGFKIYKKRGSKYFEPTEGTIRYIEDSLTGIEREKLLKSVQEKNSKMNKATYGNKENEKINQ